MKLILLDVQPTYRVMNDILERDFYLNVPSVKDILDEIVEGIIRTLLWLRKYNYVSEHSEISEAALELLGRDDYEITMFIRRLDIVKAMVLDSKVWAKLSETLTGVRFDVYRCKIINDHIWGIYGTSYT